MHRTPLVILAAVLLGAAAFVAPDAGAQPAGDAVRGKVAFAQFGCYECHGTLGQGEMYAGPAIAPRPIPLNFFLAYIRAPKNNMPPYTARILPDDVARDIHAYLTTIPAGSPAGAAAVREALAAGPPLPPAIAHGRELFVENCAKCHGSAPIGPPLGNLKVRLSLAQTVQQIKNPPLTMPKLHPSPLSDRDVDDVAAYAQTL